MGEGVDVPPPSVKITKVQVEAAGSIRIVLEADPGTSGRTVTVPGTILSATVVDGAGTPFGGATDEDQVKDMVQALNGTDHEATVVIQLVSPSGVGLTDSNFASFHVLGDFVCLDAQGAYVGTDEVKLSVSEDGQVRITTHSVH